VEAPPQPSEDFVEKVKVALREVLPEFLHDAEPEPEPEPPKAKAKGRKTLREEEDDFESLVTKVVDKVMTHEPPAPAPKAEPETPPGPPPKRRRVQSAIWGL
jgi:hypothetical protein